MPNYRIRFDLLNLIPMIWILNSTIKLSLLLTPTIEILYVNWRRIELGSPVLTSLTFDIPLMVAVEAEVADHRAALAAWAEVQRSAEAEAVVLAVEAVEDPAAVAEAPNRGLLRTLV